MQADLLVILLVLVLGCAAFVFGLLELLRRMLGFVWRSMNGLLGPRREKRADGEMKGPTRGVVCPRTTCRHVEIRKAVYCSQCGSRLSR